MSTDNCGHTIIDEDGYEQPCDLPAGEWRWYQDVEHEDMLASACVIHANEGGGSVGVRVRYVSPSPSPSATRRTADERADGVRG